MNPAGVTEKGLGMTVERPESPLFIEVSEDFEKKWGNGIFTDLGAFSRILFAKCFPTSHQVGKQMELTF